MPKWREIDVRHFVVGIYEETCVAGRYGRTFKMWSKFRQVGLILVVAAGENFAC